MTTPIHFLKKNSKALCGQELAFTVLDILGTTKKENVTCKKCLTLLTELEKKG